MPADSAADLEPLDPGEAARQARARRRCAQLLVAAARLMEHRGADAVSMQAIASEAEVSVGLIYRYFANKEELLLAVILDVLDDFETRVPAAIAAAGSDPVHQLAAAFRAYCAVIDQHPHAAILSYRESRNLSSAGRNRIKQLEIDTQVKPLIAIIKTGISRGVFQPVDADVVAYNLVLAAHAWALKHWYFEGKLDLNAYVDRQTALVLSAVIKPTRRRSYAPLLTASV